MARWPRFNIAGIPVEAGEAHVVERAWGTLGLVIANVIVYIITAGPTFFMATTPYWVRLAGFPPILVLSDPTEAYRVLTSMFIHGDILHIFFNMYFLYMFGRAVEGSLGTLRFLILYFASGIAAAIFHTVYSFLAGVSALAIPAVGASGAISGVLGAYMMLYPGTRLTACFWFPLPICYTTYSAYFLLFWFALQVLYGYAATGMATIAFFAHAGGFVAGIALLPLLADKARIEMLRAATSFGRLFGAIVIPYPVYTIARKGLSAGVKTAFALLTTLLLIGSLYASITAVAKTQVVDTSRIDAVTEGTVSTGFIVYHHVNGNVKVYGLEFVPDEVRVLIYRLYYSGLLYDPARADQVYKTVDARLTAEVPICGGERSVDVPVYIEYFNGKYNDNGILVYGEGKITTFVVLVERTVFGCRYNILRTPVTVDFTIDTIEEVNLSIRILGLAALALLTSTLALYTVLARDHELVITPM